MIPPLNEWPVSICRTASSWTPPTSTPRATGTATSRPSRSASTTRSSDWQVTDVANKLPLEKKSLHARKLIKTGEELRKYIKLLRGLGSHLHGLIELLRALELCEGSVEEGAPWEAAAKGHEHLHKIYINMGIPLKQFRKTTIEYLCHLVGLPGHGRGRLRLLLRPRVEELPRQSAGRVLGDAHACGYNFWFGSVSLQVRARKYVRLKVQFTAHRG